MDRLNADDGLWQRLRDKGRACIAAVLSSDAARVVLQLLSSTAEQSKHGPAAVRPSVAA